MIYVDDFCIIGATQAQGQAGVLCLLELLEALGFTVSGPKTILPCQDLVMLGLRLESNWDRRGGMRVSVPELKLRKAECAVNELLAGRTPLTKRSLQHTIGYLSHICQAIYSGRAYLRGLIEYLNTVRGTRGIVRWTAQAADPAATPATREEATSPAALAGTEDSVEYPAGQEAGPKASAESQTDDLWSVTLNPLPVDSAEIDDGTIGSLPRRLRKDLRWWSQSARTYNGKTSLLKEPEMQPGYFATDASDWGIGGFLGRPSVW